jgi:hypothetical protein
MEVELELARLDCGVGRDQSLGRFYRIYFKDVNSAQVVISGRQAPDNYAVIALPLLDRRRLQAREFARYSGRTISQQTNDVAAGDCVAPAITSR